MTVPEPVKHITDAAAVAVAGATWLDWLPDLAAALSVLWLAIRIYETRTVQGLVKRWRR